MGPIHAGEIWTDRRWREGVGFAMFRRVVIATGSNPDVVIRGRGGCRRLVPSFRWLEALDSDQDFRSCKAGRPTLRRTSTTKSQFRAATYSFAGSRVAALPICPRPERRLASRPGLPSLLVMIFASESGDITRLRLARSTGL